MNYLKSGLFICMIGLFFQAPVNAISWQNPTKFLSGLKSSVLKIVRPLGRFTQKAATYIKNNRRKTAIIATISAAVAVACYGLWRYARRFDGLTTTDPHAFCNWAVRQLNSLDANGPYLERTAKTPDIVGRIHQGHELTRAISARLFDISARNVDERYEAMQDRYEITAHGAPLLGGPHAVHAFFGLQPYATYSEVRRALGARELQYANELQHGAPANPDLHATLRQLNYITGTPFGWANYCAYVRGREFVEQLPRVAQVFLEALIGRVAVTQAAYGQMEPAL